MGRKCLSGMRKRKSSHEKIFWEIKNSNEFDAWEFTGENNLKGQNTIGKARITINKNTTERKPNLKTIHQSHLWI